MLRAACALPPRLGLNSLLVIRLAHNMPRCDLRDGLRDAALKLSYESSLSQQSRPCTLPDRGVQGTVRRQLNRHHLSHLRGGESTSRWLESSPAETNCGAVTSRRL